VFFATDWCTRTCNPCRSRSTSWISPSSTCRGDPSRPVHGAVQANRNSALTAVLARPRVEGTPLTRARSLCVARRAASRSCPSSVLRLPDSGTYGCPHQVCGEGRNELPVDYVAQSAKTPPSGNPAAPLDRFAPPCPKGVAYLVRTTSTEPIKRPPFPREAVRDLLGITRALYRAELAAPSPDRGKLERLHQIGKEFRMALDLGAKYEPDTMAGRAARGWADQATAARR
jgi:hypothetical protein